MTAQSVPFARPRDLLLVGAGGFARETAETVAAVTDATGTLRLLGHLDDDESRWGEVDGVPVLGGTDLVHRYPDAGVVLCTGNPRDYDSRRRIAVRLGLANGRYATVVHPTAAVSRRATIGHGCVLLAGVVVTAHATIGRHVAAMPQVVVTHDDIIEDFVTLASGVRLGGGARIGAGAYIGAGALVREGIHIGAGALVGMGAVVTRDVPEGEVWAGAPARPLRRVAGPAAAAAVTDLQP
jgi:sugar O-acyltransferase (sialic acid O-acetyltransferase NeuD family)